MSKDQDSDHSVESSSPPAAALGRAWISVKDWMPEPYERVDVWMSVHASPRSMGWADEFRVPESWQRDGRWFHSHNFAEKELDASYITHWMPVPSAPAAIPSANDRLVAAAPNLLSALISLCDEASFVQVRPETRTYESATLVAAREAIAKATGSGHE